MSPRYPGGPRGPGPVRMPPNQVDFNVSLPDLVMVHACRTCQQKIPSHNEMFALSVYIF
jgi:hypothetical protein